jgi:fluoroquinolone transport system ATP-binding protein
MLTINNLTYRYPGSKEDTLKRLDFSIKKGEVFGFLGPSGSGKSTTQKILYKLLSGFKGEVIFKDKPLHDWGQDFYETIGVSFELPNHYTKLTAEENLQFFSSFYTRRSNILELLKEVGLENDAKKIVSDYSKGMKMRLNFIRALIHDPEFLFLDEPTSGLDPINADKIKRVIRQLKERGKTIFITTHNMFDADQLCDRVALIEAGEIKALDSPANLKMRYGQDVVKVIEKRQAGREHSFAMNGLGNNEIFLDLLRNQNIATIHSQEATLEEVFIKVTGSQLVK